MDEPVKDFYRSCDGWIACDECSNLIERGEKEKLTDRCIKVFQEQEEKQTPLMVREITKSWLVALHQSFWDNRTGEREVLA